MRWEDERYVRVYTRDTPDWLGLSFIAQGLFCLLLRKVDRAGILPLGKAGRRSVAVCIGHGGDWNRLEPALEELLADGCVRIEGDHLLIPNFIEAQEANQSDAARKRKQREKARAGITGRDGDGTETPESGHTEAQPVTESHETGTECHAVSGVGHAVTSEVTPNCAVPSRAEPSLAAAAERPAAARKTVMGPKSVLFVRACAVGLGHPIAPITDASEAGELEARVEALGGPEAAREVMASILRNKATDPQSARLLLSMLREVMPGEVRA
jgi:hypothetical protein